ncbi:GNAT family N-acetyltransferase [Pseudarthrobacter sp. NamE5]|uniref:GNAT family N-acetyltransferase n=1 Tax=Pseudarthrobacter sp. NamE5 TaxID=2576839 RepID=UPI00110AF9D4|nr:GNAT family protein [Pseudarthrobacter sp. NamE5]TLM82490.1 GNAT family N-acetyltransferase [Pseudarthrobacter sp. NamE5]
MSKLVNEYTQPIGRPLPDWTARPAPSRVTLTGRFCSLEPLDVDRHTDDLYTAYSHASDGRDWTYMPVGPFGSRDEYHRFVMTVTQADDPLHYAVIDLSSGKAVGTLSLMRHDRSNGAVEVGYVAFSPLLKQTPVSTEAQFLLMSYAFDELGYRRYEWKCDSLNAPSGRAAQRLGFTFEGIFRQAAVYKGRSRDTAWYSIIDSEWPQVGKALQEWLSPDNFDKDGRQKRSLSDLRASGANIDAEN